MWSVTLLLDEAGQISEAPMPLRDVRMPPAPAGLPCSLLVTVSASDRYGQPAAYTRLSATTLWRDAASGGAWMDPGATEIALGPQEKAALRSWLVERSLDAWLSSAPAVRDLLELAVTPITGGGARAVLGTWGLQPGGRWSQVLDGSYDDDEGFALYEGACPHGGCRADVLTGFGESGDTSDVTLAVCQRAHVAHFGPDDQLRVDEEADNDCWEHCHAGHDPCPACAAREREEPSLDGGA